MWCSQTCAVCLCWFGSWSGILFELENEIIHLEQEAEILDNKLTLDLSTFDKKFRELEGSVIVQTAKSGVTQGGTAARIRLANLTNAELEKNKMKYDTEIGKARAFEEANFARIRGQMARQESKIAQLKTLSSVGTSLLTMKG